MPRDRALRVVLTTSTEQWALWVTVFGTLPRTRRVHAPVADDQQVGAALVGEPHQHIGRVPLVGTRLALEAGTTQLGPRAPRGATSPAPPGSRPIAARCPGRDPSSACASRRMRSAGRAWHRSAGPAPRPIHGLACRCRSVGSNGHGRDHPRAVSTKSARVRKIATAARGSAGVRRLSRGHERPHIRRRLRIGVAERPLHGRHVLLGPGGELVVDRA